MKTLGDRAAFPRDGTISDSQEGMSLRQWLAGQALAGHCANPDHTYKSSDQLAKISVDCADATLKELAKEGR